MARDHLLENVLLLPEWAICLLVVVPRLCRSIRSAMAWSTETGWFRRPFACLIFES